MDKTCESCWRWRRDSDTGGRTGMCTHPRLTALSARPDPDEKGLAVAGAIYDGFIVTGVSFGCIHHHTTKP